MVANKDCYCLLSTDHYSLPTKFRSQTIRIIIDGYNLLHRLKPTGDTLEKKRDYLIERLTEFRSENDNVSAIAVVFDAKGGQSSIRGYATKYSIELIYAAQDESADDVIMEMVTKRKGKARDHLVISSDNRITNFASANAMNIMSSDEFAEYIEE